MNEEFMIQFTYIIYHISSPAIRHCPEVLTMWLANEALRRVKGSDVALLAASEPLWAAVAAMIFLGDVRDLGDQKMIAL